MKKLKPREWILILVPCIFALGAWQSGTDSWLRKSIREASRQELYVESVETLAITPRDVQRGYDTRLRVVFNCTGWRRPYWWANAKYGFGSSNVPYSLAIRRKNKLVALPFAKKHVAPTIGGYDRERDRYVSEYALNLATLPQTPFDVVLQSQMWITDGSRARKIASNKALVSHLVRRANSVVRTPMVSREAGLRVTHVYLARLSAADAKAGRGTYTLVAQVHYKGGTVLPENGRNFIDDIYLLDENEKIIEAWGQSMSSPPAFTIENNVIDKSGGYQLDMITFNLPKKLPRRLTLHRVLSLPGLWPLEYSAVIYDPAKGLDLRRIKRRPSDTGYTVKPTKDDVSLPVNQKPLAPDVWRSSVLAAEKYRVR